MYAWSSLGYGSINVSSSPGGTAELRPGAMFQSSLRDGRKHGTPRYPPNSRRHTIMTTNQDHEHDGEDELQAARRTAHALGQTDGAEQAEVWAELASSPQAQREVEAVQALAARLKEVARKAPRPEPSPALREAVERRLAELEPTAGRAAVQRKARPWWRNRVMALALTAACLVALAVPILRSIGLFGPGKDRNVASQMTMDEAAPLQKRSAPMIQHLQAPPASVAMRNVPGAPGPPSAAGPGLQKPADADLPANSYPGSVVRRARPTRRSRSAPSPGGSIPPFRLQNGEAEFSDVAQGGQSSASSGDASGSGSGSGGG